MDLCLWIVLGTWWLFSVWKPQFFSSGKFSIFPFLLIPEVVSLDCSSVFLFFFFFNFYLSFLTVLGLRCCVGFWLRWLLLLWSMALGHVDLSSCRRGAQQPRLPARSTGSIAAVHGLSCSWQVGSSQVRNGTRISCTGRQILCYWATREALLWFPNLLPPVLQLFIFLNEKTNIYWYI